MDTTTQLDQQTPIVATAGGAGKKYAVSIADPSGQLLGAVDLDGTIRDQAGSQRWLAPIHQPGRSDRPLELRLRISTADGTELGESRIVKYKVGPRKRHVTLAINDATGTEVARVEPRDRAGEQVAVVAGERQLATMSITKVKVGFLRKDRAHTIELDGSLEDGMRQLVLATLLRYDALLGRAVAAAGPD